MDDKTPTGEPVLDLREMGASGLKRFSGFVYEEFLHELVGQKGAAIFKEMGNNDATAAGMLFAIRMICRKVPWRVKKASEQEDDVEAAEFLESCMDDMSNPFVEVIDEILTMLQHGFAPHEIVYKRRAGMGPDATMRSKFADGRIGWRKLPLRSQDTVYRWVFDENGGIQGMEQIAPPMYKTTFIPIEKLLLFRTSVEKNNPEGKSILRGAYRAWYMKKNIENIEAIGIERDLAGLPMAFVPPEIMSSTATPQQKAIFNEVKNIVVNIRRDQQEGIVFPMAMDANGKQKYDFKLLTTGGSRQFDTDKIIQRYDSRIALTAMADFLLIGHQAVGSFALVDSKRGLFATAIGAYLDQIASVFNRYAIPRLFQLNDFSVTEYPTLEHGDTDNVDLGTLGTFLKELSLAGAPIFPNPELEAYLMKIAKLPERTEMDTSALTPEIQNANAQGAQVTDPGQKLADDTMAAVKAESEAKNQPQAQSDPANPDGNPAQ